jgi:hypothetical protein
MYALVNPLTGLPGSQGPSHGFFQFAQCLPIFHRQLHDKCTFIPPPHIARDAASKLVIVMIYLYERSTAAQATGHVFPSH